MIKKENRLKKRKEFSFIFKNGRRVNSNYFVLNYIGTKYNNYKIGFSVSKKLGNAIIRNKIKRRLREIIRTKGNMLSKKYNYIIIARKGVENMEYKEIEKDLMCLFKKSSLMSVGKK